MDNQFDAGAVERRMEAEGMSPYRWGNAAFERYAPHEHGYEKELWCVSGGITFHILGPERKDVLMRAGDRVLLPAGTPHAVTVGPLGVVCLEGHRRSG